MEFTPRLLCASYNAIGICRIASRVRHMMNKAFLQFLKFTCTYNINIHDKELPQLMRLL